MDARRKIVAQTSVCREDRVTIAIDDSRIGTRPILDLAGQGTRHLYGAVMCLRRQADDKIDRIVEQFIEGFGDVLTDIKTDFGHHSNGKRIDFNVADLNADTVDMDAVAVQMPHDRRRYWRTD